ncbi:MAG: type III-A CRISPR-associated protein Csm2 [Thermoplasmatales archaeon]|nr:type III-A CRISPR-associated protein Csm2 [Thermoplasmatales archaeon]
MNRYRERGEKGEKISLSGDIDKLTTEEIDKLADRLGKQFAGIETSQIRNVFSEVKSLQLEWKKSKKYENVERRLFLLKPKLAYATGKARERHRDLGPFKQTMDWAVNGVVNSPNHEIALNKFFDFVEAIVAYHKYYGGR